MLSHSARLRCQQQCALASFWGGISLKAGGHSCNVFISGKVKKKTSEWGDYVHKEFALDLRDAQKMLLSKVTFLSCFLLWMSGLKKKEKVGWKALKPLLSTINIFFLLSMVPEA